MLNSATVASVTTSVPPFRCVISAAALTAAEVEDDLKTWALISVMGPLAGQLWYSGETDSNLAKSSVTNGLEPAYGYSRASKTISLTEDALSQLAGCTLVVSLLKGGVRDASKDHLIGWCSVGLDALLTERVKGWRDLKSPASHPAGIAVGTASPVAYSGRISLEVRPAAELEDAAIGGRVVSLPSLRMVNIPKRWRLPVLPGDGSDDAAGAAGTEDVSPRSGQALDDAALVAMSEGEFFYRCSPAAYTQSS
jgi:hypothetical protein